MIEKKIHGINCAIIDTNEDTLLWLHKVGRWDEYQKLIRVSREADCGARGVIMGIFTEDIITATYIFAVDVTSEGLEFSYGMIMFPFNQVERRIAKAHTLLTSLGILDLMKIENDIISKIEEEFEK